MSKHDTFEEFLATLAWLHGLWKGSKKHMKRLFDFLVSCVCGPCPRCGSITIYHKLVRSGRMPRCEKCTDPEWWHNPNTRTADKPQYGALPTEGRE